MYALVALLACRRATLRVAFVAAAARVVPVFVGRARR